MHIPDLLTDTFWARHSASTSPSWEWRTYYALTLGYINATELSSIATRLLEDSDEAELCILATEENPSLLDFGPVLTKHFAQRLDKLLSPEDALRELSKHALHLHRLGELSTYRTARAIRSLWYEYVTFQIKDNFHESDFVDPLVRSLGNKFEVFHEKYYDFEANAYPTEEDCSQHVEFQQTVAAVLGDMYSAWCKG